MSKVKSFLSYFYKYLFHSKTRQKLIFLAIFGLFLSSMALLVLQGIMQGLQGEMIKRSKKMIGHHVISFDEYDENSFNQFTSDLKKSQVFFTKEIELELLGKHDAYIAPVILRGIDFDASTPNFLKELEKDGVILGADLLSKLKSTIGSTVVFFSPSHLDTFFGDVPRMAGETVSDLSSSSVNEVDEVTAYIRSSFVHNLIREVSYNKIRIYQEISKEKLADLLKNAKLSDISTITSWEELHPELLWAFKLESVVMLALFVCMCFLVSITIVAGNLIFFNKIRFDLISFWILGLSKKTISILMFLYFQVKALLTCFSGILVGGLLLLFLKKFSPNIMPDVFLEKSLPVHVTWDHVLIAFFVPYLVSSVFSIYALWVFNKENTSYIELLRKVGE